MEQKNIFFLLSLMVLLLISYTTTARLLPTINSQESNGIISNNPISSQVQEDFNDVSSFSYFPPLYTVYELIRIDMISENSYYRFEISLLSKTKKN